MLRFAFPGVALAALVATGCTSVDSDNILTSGIYASMAATADGSGETRVTTTLYLEDPGTLDFLELEGGDELWAYGPEAQNSRMREFQLLGITSYSAEFDGDFEDDEFIVEFIREVDTGAPDSRVTLPAPFDFLTEGDFTASRAEDLIVDWSPAGSADAGSWQVNGTCIDPASGDLVEDSGTLTIPAGIIQQSEDEMAPATCDVTLTLRRVRGGSVDPAFGEGGTFEGRQERTLSFTSEP